MSKPLNTLLAIGMLAAAVMADESENNLITGEAIGIGAGVAAATGLFVCITCVLLVCCLAAAVACPAVFAVKLISHYSSEYENIDGENLLSTVTKKAWEAAEATGGRFFKCCTGTCAALIENGAELANPRV